MLVARARRSSRVRGAEALLLTAPLLLAGAAPGLAAEAPAPAPAPAAMPATAPDAGGAVLNVLPPGSDGTTNAAEALEEQAGGNPRPNSDDQLALYDALATQGPGDLTEAELREYFKDAPIEPDPATVVSTETPREGVTIRRDTAGVPFVTGVTFADVAFGAGYASTQDRMFLADVLRHYGAGRTAELLGPSEANLEMDAQQLRDAAYTRPEAAAQITALSDRYGAEGQKIEDAVDDFVAGINAAQDALCPGGLPTGADCPVEYAALQVAPTPWEPADVVFVASLVGGIFGKGGGGEHVNGLWLRQLQERFGEEDGRAVFDDLREADDPEAPVTTERSFPYGGPPAPGSVDPDAVLLPDLDAPTASGTGARVDANGIPTEVPTLEEVFGGVGLSGASRAVVADGPFGPIPLGVPGAMSNALLVAADESPTGHPVAVFGPQTGYFNPQLLTEVSLQGPGVAARGVSFAGTAAVVQLGHGVDYAWSATSASGDNVDVLYERLCEPDGSEPTVDSLHYEDAGGACVPLDRYVHTELTKPSAGGQGPPQAVQFQVLRSRHGIVLLRTEAEGEPVAVTSQRSTYGGEFDSVVGFARAQDPGYVRDAASFARAFSGVDYTFNWFYLDDEDISYFESGLLPLRADGVDPWLPRPGDARFDWQGVLPFEGHPQVTDPATGYLVSWNNKPARDFAANDAQWGYGSVYRSLALSDRVEAGIAGAGTMDRVELTEAMIDAATVDSRAHYTLDQVLAVVGGDGLDPALASYVEALRAWRADGSHRVDRDRDGAYGHAGAIALFDAWWESAATSLPQAVLRGTLGDLVEELPKGLDDHPRQGVGSTWNGVPWYGYVDKDLRQVLGQPVTAPYSRTYCGGGDLAQCRDDLRASLAAAVAAQTAAQGTGDVGAWSYDKSQDFIQHTAVGLSTVPGIDWQNRPTFQQVVEFTSSREDVPAPGPSPTTAAPTARPSAAPPASDGGASPVAQPRGRLAATGVDALLPLAGLALVVAAGLAARRRTRPVAEEPGDRSR